MTPLFLSVRQIAADVFDVPPDSLTAASSPETVPAWDSLQHLNLVMAVEQTFRVEFTPEDIERMTSLAAIADVLRVHAEQFGTHLIGTSSC